MLLGLRTHSGKADTSLELWKWFADEMDFFRVVLSTVIYATVCTTLW